MLAFLVLAALMVALGGVAFYLIKLQKDGSAAAAAGGGDSGDDGAPRAVGWRTRCSAAPRLR